MFKVLSRFRALTAAGKTGVVIASIVGVGAVAAAGNSNQPTTNLNKATSAVKSAPVITHHTVTTTEPVPFTTTNVDDGTLAKGSTKPTTEGVNGVRTHTYDVTYSDGVETSRKEVSNTITTQPINKVVAVGTYEAPDVSSCPNGTYVNSAGNTVCSPYSSPSAPAGATAQCVDGTYSFSQTHSGTCSHHGGVATWL